MKTGILNLTMQTIARLQTNKEVKSLDERNVKIFGVTTEEIDLIHRFFDVNGLRSTSDVHKEGEKTNYLLECPDCYQWYVKGDYLYLRKKCFAITVDGGETIS